MNDTKDNYFTHLTSDAGMYIGKPYRHVKEKFEGRLMRLIKIIEGEKHRKFIEVDFAKRNASITYCFDTDGNCATAFIHFYDPAGADWYIDYLNKYSDHYCPRKKYWRINPQYHIKLHETESGVDFYGYIKEAEESCHLPVNTESIDFNYLIKQLFKSFGESHPQVALRYKDFPLSCYSSECIEVIFEKNRSLIAYFFDKNKMLKSTCLYLYKPSDVDLFLDFLQCYADSYDYMKKHWVINVCFLLTVNQLDGGTYFNCRKSVDC
ncbi:hypothetical protein [Dysgonomonas sp.]